MYPASDGGLGDEAMEVLRVVKSEREFRKAVKKFNEEHHNYDEKKLVYRKKNFFDSHNNVDFRNDYFGRFFSDWLFIKNGTQEEVFFKCCDERNPGLVAILPDEIMRFKFGDVEK